jgi:trans-aconitate methyltransferase
MGHCAEAMIIEDKYFSEGGWTTAGGNLQSLIFYQKALQILAESPYADILDKLTKGSYSLHDYGCAEGDGTALLQATFPVATITGFDLAPSAIARAKARWPTVSFQQGDVLAPVGEANVIWTSHTLEHLPDPAAAVQGLLSQCKWLVVMVPPIGEHDESPAHHDAVAINTWLNQIGMFPLHMSFFITERVDTEKPGHILLEESFFLLFQGRRIW